MGLGKTVLTLALIILENVLGLFFKPYLFIKALKTYCSIFIFFFAAVFGVWKKKFKNIFLSLRIRFFIGTFSKDTISERDSVIKKD